MIKYRKKNNSITVDEFNKAIKRYNNKATTSSEGSKIIVTFSNGHKYTIYKNGTIEEYTEPPYATEKLTVTVNEDGTVVSPYYVNYPSAKGKIICRVLYNDSTYGLQIISVNPITKVTLGKNDTNQNVTGAMGSLERAQNSYNRAIITLNEKAEEYQETTDGSILSADARCVGSNPLNKNYPDNLTGDERTSEMFTSTETYMNNYNGKYFKGNTHYETDKTRLDKIGATSCSVSNNENNYWLASRVVSSTYMFSNFMLYHISDLNHSLSNDYLWILIMDGRLIDNAPEHGLRPVFILSPNVKIIDGEGTEEAPFEIGL